VHADARGRAAVLTAPAALDLANVRALASTSGIGAVVVLNIGDTSLLDFIVAKSARQDLISIVLARSETASSPHRIVLGGPAGLRHGLHRPATRDPPPSARAFLTC
jgi:LDH2 family malate/lactate/ureidoglycolate dehydrogenase